MYEALSYYMTVYEALSYYITVATAGARRVISHRSEEALVHDLQRHRASLSPYAEVQTQRTQCAETKRFISPYAEV